MEKKDKNGEEKKSVELELLPAIDLDKEGMSLQPKLSQNFNDNTNLFNIVDGFTELENNLFFACIAQVNDRGPSKVKFSVRAMRQMIGYKKHVNMKEFADLVMQAFKKFLQIQEEVTGLDDNGRPFKYRANLFNSGMVYVDNLECVISVSPRFTQLFNNLERWTRFSIQQYTRIHSVYSKKIFILLKQFRTTGVRYFTIEEFYEKINPPKSYKTWHIYQKIVEPAVEDLAPFFKNLSVTSNYKKGVRGRKLAGYTFTWNPEAKNQPDFLKNNALEETQAFYNIKSNTFLSTERKFRAIDKLRGVKMGTTEKMYKGAHPNTIFLDPEASITSPTSRPMFIRGDLEEVQSYSVDQVYQLVKFYEKLNKAGALMLDDIKDLKALELLLINKARKRRRTKQKIQSKKAQGYDDYYDNQEFERRKDTIAYRLIDYNDTDTRNIDESRKQAMYKENIELTVNQQWGGTLRDQDYRPPELTELFDEN